MGRELPVKSVSALLSGMKMLKDRNYDFNSATPQISNMQIIKSASFQGPKNGTSSAQIKEGTPKSLQNTPQNGGVDIWFMRFHFRVSIKPIFENHFRAVYPLKRPKT